MAKAVLADQQRLFLQQERQIVNELYACLKELESATAYAATLQQVSKTLDDPFLLVIVGEFNAGKSACINALLHDEVLEEGVTPTTSSVTILRYGQHAQHETREPGLLEVHYPAEFLRDISIVDTPGVNAILLEHQRLTEEFVPRSDLILFVTSIDRPFTQSERVFLERIRSWGKKIVIILNKIDILRNPQELQKVLLFIQDNCKQLLGFQPDIFPVSAHQAQQARLAMGHQAVELWERSRFGRLEEYLFQTLDEKERIRLKLLSPLGVMYRILTETQRDVEERARLLAEDARTVSTIDQQLKLYTQDMESNVSHRINEIERIIVDMQMRGDAFFNDTIRLRHLFELLQSERIRETFEREVLGDSAQRIERSVNELIDWLVEQEHRLWQQIMEYIDRRRQVSLRRENEDQMVGTIGRQFDYNRRMTLQSVSHTVYGVIQTYNPQQETAQLAQDLRNTVAQIAIAGVSGVGLGALIATLIGTLAADFTGIIAGAVILGLGFGILPLRRRKAQQSFDQKMDELRLRLRNAVSEQFRKELNNSKTRVQEAIAPYTRFVRAEQEKTAALQTRLTTLDRKMYELQSQIESVQKL